ncbi:diguanylate cyclase [Microbacteriaceae bacterium K1510]|nr:diguanylate cyclase [Microbacteriaceae bacterium K1510]
MLILAMAAIVPLALERIYSIETERHADIEDARMHALFVARQGAEKQGESIAAARGMLQLIAAAYPKYVANKVPCSEFLKTVLVGVPGVKSFSVVSPKGEIICSAIPETIGLDVSDRPYFQQVRHEGGFALSDYANGRRIKGPTLFLAYAEPSADGTIDAIFTALLDLDWIGRVAADIADRSGSEVLLIDGTGTPIVRYPDPEKWAGKPSGHLPLIKTALDHAEGVIDAAGVDGISRIYAFMQLPGTDARFIVGVNMHDVLQKVNAAMLRSYGQLSIVAALVLTGIWYGGERLFVRPIRALAQTATEIGQGDLAARAMRYGDISSEFMPLAVAMDNMADQLALREAQLRATNEQLEELAQRDGLTGAANRRVFDARLRAAWQVSSALASPLALLMIDIDHFKQFNDRYGHLEGDACLREVAKVLITSARNDDLAVRYGGEEFAVLLPGALTQQAQRIAERLRRSVEELAIAHADSEFGRVTISIGVATTVDSGATSIEDFVRAADEALYAAKAWGRNRVAVCWSASLLTVS